ncbi:LytTR family DNA-binding domain-containing protein [Flavitalea sp. BT771]|uniref:LytR/AlgR family response regulator transcription factor n=1 Tax=Flavitalea sp. BT771 TaxID=3063329 RepID=UPI0026E1AAB3|nr:LytTR family DNA-binding domain-containing protein [Flavitalea sp. BT771]MDO6432696.1 LytTR family DNA-binding domain-containing protein [Flavitalea sp. BT771]MDV6222028.1 LytTR family DNA-binding domain-containing protein [Flavitalea sp. BT771]
MTYNCLIIDDEPLARKVIEKHLQSFPQLKVWGSAENAIAAFQLLHTQTIHLLFLDIQMPAINGLQLLRSLKHPPAVIFTTAYTEYAAESYDLDALDYLVKPVGFERFERSIRKFLHDTSSDALEKTKFFLVKKDGKLNKVLCRDILYIESRKDYVMLYTANQSYIKHMTMKSIEELLGEDQFKRVHRSFIVAMPAVTEMYNNALKINKKTIPIGEKYKKEVLGSFRDIPGNLKF